MAEGPYVNSLFNASPQELNYRNRCEIASMEMQAFTLSLFKFFCRLGNCDYKELYGTLVNIDMACQGIINETYKIQLNIYDLEATNYDTEESYGSEAFPTSSENQYNSGSWESYEDSISQEIDENQSIATEVQDRISRLNLTQESADLIREGVLNLQKTETNLRRFTNFTNLNDLSAFERKN